MPVYQGSCHCGAVAFEIDSVIEELITCNCTLCVKKNALMARVDKDKLTITRGADNLALYQWNFKIAKHYFCKTCGIYPFHQRRSDPEVCGVNVHCLENFDVASVPVTPFTAGADMSVAGEDP